MSGLDISKNIVRNFPTIRRTVIIGCGGIGGHLWDWIAHETWSRAKLNDLDSGKYRRFCDNFLLVDNDVVEEKNLFRQSFFPEQVGMPKAEALASKYKQELENYGIYVDHKRAWLDEESDFLQENDLILLCVDNHSTRKIINDMLKSKRYCNIVLINGGNRDSLVTVQVMIVANKYITTASLEHMHPEISNPEDEHPRNASCLNIQSAAEDPQLFRANLMAAMQMFQIFINALDRGTADFCELWIDVEKSTFRKEPIPEKEIII